MHLVCISCIDNLRARQRDLAKHTIVDACAELVTERHHLDFSMKEVAERAGVSLRTVYNHFATREDLLDVLGVAMDQQSRELGGPQAHDLETCDDLITDFIAQQMPSVPEHDSRTIAVMLRHLLNHRSWFWLTREYGLDTADVIRVVNWTIEVVIAAAEAGDLPDPKENHDHHSTHS